MFVYDTITTKTGKERVKKGHVKVGNPSASLADTSAGDPRRLMSGRNRRQPGTRSVNTVSFAPSPPAEAESRWESAIRDYWDHELHFFDADAAPSDFS